MKLLPCVLLILLVGKTVNSYSENRIIDGVEANPNDDFVVRIRSSYDEVDIETNFTSGYVSSGVVISEKHVLTVGQATYEFKTVEIVSFNYPGNEIIVEAHNIHTHPDYNPETLEHNIGIIISAGGSFLEDVRQLQVTDRPPSSTVYFLFGIGLTGDAEDALLSDTIKYTVQTAVNHAECLSAYNRLVVTESNFCGRNVDNSLPFHGDQGGPVTTLNRNLLGLISAFGSDIASPTIYTDVYAPSEHAFISCVLNDIVMPIELEQCMSNLINS